MDRPKHTPGPWKVCGASDGRCSCGMIWEAGGNFVVAAALSKCQRFAGYTAGEGVDSNSEEYHANVHLIAAAPQLLEACKLALEHCEELRDAWARGVISEHDGKGGLRSNRNVSVEAQLRKAISATEQEPRDGN